MAGKVPFAYGTREFYQYIGRLGGQATASKFRGNIRKALTELAGRIADTARQNVFARGLPSDIADAISVGEVIESGKGYEISISVDLGDPNALGEARQARSSARAFEYGSGVHNPRADTRGYTIAPREAGALVFPFTLTFLPGGKFRGMIVNGKFMNRRNVGKMFDTSSSGRVSSDKTFWNEVLHPGVEARPYLRPAIKSHEDEIKKVLRKAFKDSFVGEKFTRIEVHI